MEEAGALLQDVPDTRTTYEKKWDEQVYFCRALCSGVRAILTSKRADGQSQA
jgi:hypothetical protein